MNYVGDNSFDILVVLFGSEIGIVCYVEGPGGNKYLFGITHRAYIKDGAKDN